MFAKKVGCAKCKIEVCSSCREQWHDGIKCTKEDGTELKWDAIGNPIQSKVSRCPGCKAPFEKISGCPHMNCMVCNYEWCWNCGSKWKSPIHRGAGAIFCELFGQMRNKCPFLIVVVLTMLLLVTWPIFALIIL